MYIVPISKTSQLDWTIIMLLNIDGLVLPLIPTGNTKPAQSLVYSLQITLRVSMSWENPEDLHSMHRCITFHASRHILRI